MSEDLKGHCGIVGGGGGGVKGSSRTDVATGYLYQQQGDVSEDATSTYNNNNKKHSKFENFPLLNKYENSEKGNENLLQVEKTEMKTNVRFSEGNFVSSKNETSGKEKEEILGDTSLPQIFTVKYLGKCDASGLWGIKHTRKPVDYLVTEARKLKTGVTLPYLKLVVSEEGVDITGMPQNKNENYENGLFPIHMISYGVQDLVYTRVFAMITVCETNNIHETHPFQCHAFVCDSRQTARQLTISLASAFAIFSESVKAKELKSKPKKFAIDLRTAEELREDEQLQPEDDSEV